MDCCCPASTQPVYGAYISTFQSTRFSNKNKFSFRTTAAGSSRNSRVSQNSQQISHDKEKQVDNELKSLERQYEQLKLQQAEIDHFQKYRVKQLEEEVAYYQREIQQRCRDIDEINHLFKIKLQQRNGIIYRSQNQQYHQQIKQFGQNDSTTISSVPPNI